MKGETLLDILCRERMGNALENSLRNCDRYNRAEKIANRKMDKALKQGLNRKQKLAIDEAFTAYNYSNAEYGRASYLQGFRDGISLFGEIFNNT